MNGEMRNTHTSVRKFKGKKPFEKFKQRWKNDIKTNLKEIGFEGMNCIQLACNRAQ
jgi:hypothetical protein